MSSGEGYSASEGGSRKRLKISRNDSRHVSNADAKPVLISSDAPVKSEADAPALNGGVKSEQNGVHVHDGPCHHETSLRTLHGDLESMRGLITCKICQHFLYEPYALTCGHTFCYSCLMQWMGNNAKKTCPDCRAVIKEEPSPSYLVREMVHIFGSRSELLADGETAEEHAQAAKEEADLVAKDKANTDVRTGGLFKGRFRKGSRFAPLIAIRDHSDNVDRCPQCTNETEEGWCMTCAVRVIGEEDGFDFSDDSEDDMDEELDHDLDDAELEEDMNLAFDGNSDFGEHRLFHGDVNVEYQYNPAFRGTAPSFYRHMSPDSDEDEDSEDDEEDLSGFVDDEVRYESDADDGLSDSDGTAIAGLQPRTIIVSDSDDDEHAPVRARRRVVPRVSEEASTGGASRQSDSESEDDGPIVTSQRNRLRARPITIVSDDDESDEEDADEEDGAPEDDEIARVNLANHYAIHGYSSQSEGSDDEGQNYGHDYQGEHGYGYDYDVHSEGQTAGLGPSEMSDAADDSDDDEEEEEESDEDDTQNPGATDDFTYPPSAHTYGPSCVRHISPEAPRLPYGLSLMDFQRYYQARGYPNEPTQPPPITTQPVPSTTQPPARPTHPFQLGDTLARLNREREQATNAEPGSRPKVRRPVASLSSQSSAGGGVDVRESPSGSSGSSRTVRERDFDDYEGEPWQPSTRRRMRMSRYLPVKEDESD